MTTPTDPPVAAPPPIIVAPIVKPWHASKTLMVNLAVILLFVLTAVASGAGVFHLRPEVIALLGIATGAINVALRLSTNSAIDGTPAASVVLSPTKP